MIVYSICILKDNKINQIEYNLDSFSFISRYSIKEFINLFTRLCSEKTKNDQIIQKITHEQYSVYTLKVVSRDQEFCFCITSDIDYPNYAAHSVLQKLKNEFNTDNWNENKLKEFLLESQKHVITTIKTELEETKVILHKNIDLLLERGEKIEDLLHKSNELSNKSISFYKMSKKTNRGCCFLM